jgi:hypothetical protein
MRASTKYALSLVSAIVVACLAFYLYLYIQNLPAVSVPGQYPINEQRPVYSGVSVTKHYSPSPDMGSDELPPSYAMSAKMRCATSSNGMC